MHATVLYRRDIRIALGGFDEGLRRCEDYDLYLRIARRYLIASHPEIIAEYRWHDHNMSLNTEEMLRAALAVHARHRGQTPEQRRAWRAGKRSWKAWYKTGQLDWGGPPASGADRPALERLKRSTARLIQDRFVTVACTLSGRARVALGRHQSGGLISAGCRIPSLSASTLVGIAALRLIATTSRTFWPMRLETYGGAFWRLATTPIAGATARTSAGRMCCTSTLTTQKRPYLEKTSPPSPIPMARSWVHVGFGYPMVNQDHRFLMEDSAPTMEALCR